MLRKNTIKNLKTEEKKVLSIAYQYSIRVSKVRITCFNGGWVTLWFEGGEAT